MNILCSAQDAKAQLSKFRDREFREHQKEAIEWAMNSDKKIKVIEAPTGCHHPDQGILLSDGSVKFAKNISIGDVLVNEVGDLQTVTSLVSGHGKMFKIIPIKGSSWIVNENHILTLKRTNCTKQNASINKLCKNGEIIDVEVKEWLNWTKTKKHFYKILRQGVKSFNYTKKPLPIDPYMVGLLLGNGMMYNGSVGISIGYQETIQYIQEFAKTNLLNVRKSKSNPYDYFFSKEDNKFINNIHINNRMKLVHDLELIGIYGCKSGDKFVPFQYKTSEWNNRLEILAGLLDSDGSMSHGGFEYTSKSEQLSTDVAFLARSLGLAAYVKSYIKRCQNNFSGTYHRVTISGDCSIIPCRVSRKKSPPRFQKKNVLVTGFAIEEVEEGEFCGWTLTGNGRYLLSDFTVTHNSGKSLLGMTCGVMAGSANYLCSTKILQSQIVNDFPESRILWGRANYLCALDNSKNCDQCSSTKINQCPVIHQCLYKKEKQKVLDSPLRILNFSYAIAEQMYAGKFKGTPLTVVDECDSLESTLISTVQLSFNERSLFKLGLESGPSRKTVTAKDGIESWKEFGSEAMYRSKTIADNLTKEIESWDSIESDDQHRKIRERNNFVHLYERCKIFIESVDSSWLMERTERQGSRQATTTFRPLWMDINLAERFMWNNSPSFILMSATMLPKPILCKTLGLDPDDVDYLRVPSNFPAENRPIYFRNVANMTAKTTDEELPNLVKDIKEVMKMHKNERGIIHTSSYLLAKKISDALNSDRVVIHTSLDREEVINRFMNSDEPLVIISPSLSRGVSCEDDKARWCYIAKAPFLSLGDIIVNKRVYSGKIGQKWYVCTMLMDVVQMTGRIVRSMTDHGVSYIGDKQVFKALSENVMSVPQWWMDAVD
jgi:Rad3-related DNA helicase